MSDLTLDNTEITAAGLSLILRDTETSYEQLFTSLEIVNFEFLNGKKELEQQNNIFSYDRQGHLSFKVKNIKKFTNLSKETNIQ